MNAPSAHAAPRGHVLGIEISNPSSGPRGVLGGDRRVIAGPGVALGGPDGGCIDAEGLHEGTRHDDDLMPAIARLLERNGATPGALARVAVSVGPGGYTSLRIAVATAKMLAEATGAEVVAVPSASVAAWSLSPDLAPALVCLASKGESAYGVMLPAESWLDGARALGLVDASTVREVRPRTVIGDRFLPPSVRDAAAEVGAAVVEPAFSAAFVLRIAPGLPATDPVQLAPVYSREPEAVTQWRKRKRDP